MKKGTAGDRVAPWEERFHHEVISHIDRAGVRDQFKEAMNDLHVETKYWFHDQNFKGVKGPAWITHAQTRTFIQACQVLAKLECDLPLRELLFPWLPGVIAPDQRLGRLEMLLERIHALDSVVSRTLPTIMAEASRRFIHTLEGEMSAIRGAGIIQHRGYVTGPEMHTIGSVCSHVRIVTSRLDLGVIWNRDGSPSRRPEYFAITRDRLAGARHTYIVPDGSTVINPDHYNPHITWEQRVQKLASFYQDDGGIPERTWKKNINFRYSPLPIPASIALFEMTGEKFAWLKRELPEFGKTLDGDPTLYLQMPKTGRTFIGMGYSGAAIPQLTTLMSASSIVFASNAFITYWQSLPRSERSVGGAGLDEPLIGLPTSLETEFQDWPAGRVADQLIVERRPAALATHS